MYVQAIVFFKHNGVNLKLWAVKADISHLQYCCQCYGAVLFTPRLVQHHCMLPAKYVSLVPRLSILQATESWAGPGNEATCMLL